MKLKPLNQQTIVITGATSGIGLATARLAAERGAKLVLAARSEADLHHVGAELSHKGAQVVTVAADVASVTDIQRIATTAKERFGGLDTWINNAAASIWGRLEEVSHEDSHRMFETNFWGVVYGSLAAVKHLKKRGGALINLGSVASDIAFPLQGMYSASKHAIKGFTDALRQELEEEGAPISVTLIKPSAINTPFPQHARNYMDKEPKLPPPVYEPEEVANAIVHAAEHPERDIYIGGGGKMFSTMNKHLPRAMDFLNEKVNMKLQTRDEPPRNPAGSLHGPYVRDGKAHGTHPGYVMQKSLYTRASLHPVITGAFAALAGGILVALLSGKNSSSSEPAEENESATA
ncbi:SDR family oxidoreductase [Hymenobacter taeanensis]|uniref:SDR family oxidoreductase n=1 Tax=Hymenobacter taeanensis TaxID=2735321 RepID=A0A6M6BF25_9BACT|nr:MULTISPECIES: SDR family oxidoreductase [Hymenobacter]QJX45833.1 SDR family oxidoreductase [Hymenobacter taeanensis]UOQ79676.1 SDR family oxidoreductase [Hymenobacter sp. 5414T-23]